MLFPAINGTVLAQGAARGYRGRAERTESAPSSSGVIPAIGQEEQDSDSGIQLTAKRSFLDRLFGVTKRPPSGPPQDPGMTYPKASQQRRVNPQTAEIPSVAPPVTGTATVRTPNVQLPPATDLNAPQLPPGAPPAILPPAIDAEPALSLSPTAPQDFVAPAPANQMRQPKAMSELKEMLGVNGNSAAPAETTLPPAVDLSISSSGLPPATDLSVKTSEIMPLEPAPMTGAEPEVEAPQVAETQPVAKPTDDPFADLFPEDDGQKPAADPEFKQPIVKTETPVQTVEPTQPMQEQEVAVETTAEPEKPYTGLTLEEDLFESDPVAKAPVEMPAPPVESTASRSELTLPPVGATAEPTVTAEAESAPAPMVEAEPQPKKEPLKVASLPKATLELKPELPPMEKSEVAVEEQAPVEQEAPVQKKATVAQKPSNPEHDSKLQKIAAREGLTGLKGFCPVTLRDHRDLVDSHEDYSAIFNGKRYQFATEEALEAFLDDPVKYAPATRGSDVIHLALTGEEKEGTLDYAVWYRGRLYLFSSPETMETFVAAPSSHATND